MMTAPLFLAHVEADGWPSHTYAFETAGDRDAFTEAADKIAPGWYDIEPDAVEPLTVEAAIAKLRADLRCTAHRSGQHIEAVRGCHDCALVMDWPR